MLSSHIKLSQTKLECSNQGSKSMCWLKWHLQMKDSHPWGSPLLFQLHWIFFLMHNFFHSLGLKNNVAFILISIEALQCGIFICLVDWNNLFKIQWWLTIVPDFVSIVSDMIMILESRVNHTHWLSDFCTNAKGQGSCFIGIVDYYFKLVTVPWRWLDLWRP